MPGTTFNGLRRHRRQPGYMEKWLVTMHWACDVVRSQRSVRSMWVQLLHTHVPKVISINTYSAHGIHQNADAMQWKCHAQHSWCYKLPRTTCHLPKTSQSFVSANAMFVAIMVRVPIISIRMLHGFGGGEGQECWSPRPVTQNHRRKPSLVFF